MWRIGGIMIYWFVIFLLAADPAVYVWVVKKDGVKNNHWPFSGYIELCKYLKHKDT